MSSDSIITDALLVYGSTFALLFLIYIIIRPHFPKIFLFRDSMTETLTTDEHHERIRWIWRIFQYSDEDIFQDSGLDSIVFIRILRFGMKIAFVGIFNSIYLIPINMSGCDSYSDCSDIGGAIERAGIGNISQGSSFLIATTVSCYVLFGSAMYLLFQEFQWFTVVRHKFLQRMRPDNYSVYVAHIPPMYRSKEALSEYFQTMFDAQDVISVNVAVDVPNLEEKVATREETVIKLEHAINVRNIKNINPQHLTITGKKVDSIETYAAQVDELNSEISSMIADIEDKKSREKEKFEERKKLSSHNIQQDGSIVETSHLVEEMRDDVSSEAKELVTSPTGLARKAGNNMLSYFNSLDDGKPRDGGFVTFSRLLTKAQAVQMIHDDTPFAFDVSNAPQPTDIFWENVGLSHKKQQVGSVLAVALTTGLCLFWTIPLVFFSSFAELNELKELLPFLEKAIRNAPWLEGFLAQLKPLLIILLMNQVPWILTYFTKHQGHVSLTTLQASVYLKLSVFNITQLFFVQAITGSIFQELPEMVKDWTKIVMLLARSVPGQVASLGQYVITKTFLGCSFELLRVVPIIIAFFREKFGPNLTKKERNSVWMGMAPLSVPTELDYPSVLSDLMVYFMILFVYASIAPVMSFLYAFVFFLLNLTYRNQLLHIYSPEHDSGGQFWARSIRIIIFCMVASEIIVTGILILSEGLYASIFMAPLIGFTLLFSIYLNQQHYKVTDYLPSIRCQVEDLKNIGGDLSFLEDKYVQPALLANEVHIDLDGTSC